MTKDKTYEKQLKQFGIESVRVVNVDPKKQAQKEYRQSSLNVVKMLMDTMEGRQWLYGQLDMCQVFTTPFVPSDPHGTSFFSGAQAIGQKLLADIMTASPENFYLMTQEAAARTAVLVGKEIKS